VDDLLKVRVGPRRGFRRATSALAWYERALACEGRDDDAAVHAYERAIAGRPDFADAHNNLGRVLHDRGRLEAAEACYRRALAVAPDVGLYHYNLAVALEDRGETTEAVAAYEHALVRDASLADAHFNLARLIEVRARSSGDELAMRRAVRHLRSYRELSRRGQAR
jgi:tetratricopeptide (TPR) repeat protein